LAHKKDYYAILQVNPKATQPEIERAYERLSAAYDPGRSEKRRAAERRADVQEAYLTLKDPGKRRSYDRERASPSRESHDRDTLSKPFVIMSSGIIGACVVVVLVLAALQLTGGSSSTTGQASNPSGTPTEAEQTPGTIQPSTPPKIVAPFATTSSGLQVAVLLEGTGAPTQVNAPVTINYTGWVQGGEFFDSTLNPGGKPLTFTLGQGQVIKAIDEVVATMRVGGVVRIIVPPELGYGASPPSDKVPPNATLVYDLSVIGVGTPAQASASASP